MRYWLLTCLAFSLLAPPLCAQQTSPQFRRLDANRDDVLTKDELPTPLFERIDTNRDGRITPAEDQAFVRRANPQGPNQARLPETVRAERDLPYAQTDNARQRLDLYLPVEPANDEPLPVVVSIHGGGWARGDKRAAASLPIELVATGHYAGVSVGYRLTNEAIWPAQLHDCKAAIRWLRANAKKYNLDPNRIGVTGTSAGGHLAAMLGTSGDVKELEGDLGPHREFSSRVACVADQYGPTDLLSMGGWHDEPQSPESRLLGGPPPAVPDLARAASPTTYVSADDPPFLIIHGTRDPAVPFKQSEVLAAKLQQAKVATTFVPVTHGGHGGFGTPAVRERIRLFFDKYLRGQDLEISAEAIAAGTAK